MQLYNVHHVIHTLDEHHLFLLVPLSDDSALAFELSPQNQNLTSISFPWNHSLNFFFSQICVNQLFVSLRSRGCWNQGERVLVQDIQHPHLLVVQLSFSNLLRNHLHNDSRLNPLQLLFL